MTLFETIKDRPGFKKQSNNSWEGPCSKCSSNRLIVWANIDAFKCLDCGFKGDFVEWLREVDGYSCREAFLEAGKDCVATDCPYYEKCKSITTPRKRKPKSLAPSVAKAAEDWQPRTTEKPVDVWQRKATEFVAWAHEQLLGCPEQLEYLASRGLSLEAVKEYRLGWNPGEIRRGQPGPLFKQRSAWALDEKWNDDTKKRVTVLAIQRGIIIPSFADDSVYRIRIRRPDADLIAETKDGKKPPKYLFLEGSGKGLVIRDRDAKAFLIVESDLDDLLIHWLARDLICPVPLTSCGIRPDADSEPVFRQAICLLNALDYDPRSNPQTGKYENPGGQGARWWQKHFPNSERWPPPAGKDPGEAWKAGVDIRRWILDGLPISLHPRQTDSKIQATKQEGAVSFDVERMLKMIMAARARVDEACPKGALAWLAESRVDIAEHLQAADRAVDAIFESRDELALMKALDSWEKYHMVAWQRYEERPKIVARCKRTNDNKEKAA